MYFDNQCNAPNDFIDSLKKAWDQCEYIAFQQLNSKFQPFLVIRILEQDPDPKLPDPKYSLARVSEMTQFLITILESSSQGDDFQEIIGSLRKLWLLLIGEIKSDGTYSLDQLVNEINSILKNLENASSVDSKEIYRIWKELVHLISLIDYPMIRLGYYSPADDEITICYEEIRSSAPANYVSQYGAFVLSHEFFHALHHRYMVRKPIGKNNWSSVSQPANIRRRAVKESLAEYFSLAFAQINLSHYVWQKARSVSTLHPFEYFAVRIPPILV